MTVKSIAFKVLLRLVTFDVVGASYDDGPALAFPIGPPPSPPRPPTLPAGPSLPPPAACGEKTPERAIRDGDLIAFDCALPSTRLSYPHGNIA